jgi:archaellum component FlaF (FlaF/FlaG flagellin family)
LLTRHQTLARDLRDGFFSADAAGRAKMEALFVQNGHFDNATIAFGKVVPYTAAIDRGRPGTAHIRMFAPVVNGDTISITANGTIATYVAANPVLNPTDYLNTGVPAVDIIALQAVMQAMQGANIVSAVHAVDTTVIDLRSVVAGPLLVALVGFGAASVAAQNNYEQLTPASRNIWQFRRTVTAEDVLRTRVRFDTGLTNIRGYVLRVIAAAADNTEILYDGTITITGGVIDMDNTGMVDLALNQIIMLEVQGD